MSTTSKEIADRIVACNGDPDEPWEVPIERVVKYTNAWSGDAYGLTFEGQDPNTYLRETEYVKNPIIYFERKR